MDSGLIEEVGYALFRRHIISKLKSGYYEPEHCYWKEDCIKASWSEDEEARQVYLDLAREAVSVMGGGMVTAIPPRPELSYSRV